jgi:hypothetical protein
MENNITVVVNPITRVATVIHKTNNETYMIGLSFNDLDEWTSFVTDALYAVHFLYDEYFNLYITEVNTDESEGAIRGDRDVDFLLVIEYTDDDYKLAIHQHTKSINF